MLEFAVVCKLDGTNDSAVEVLLEYAVVCMLDGTNDSAVEILLEFAVVCKLDGTNDSAIIIEILLEFAVEATVSELIDPTFEHDVGIFNDFGEAKSSWTVFPILAWTAVFKLVEDWAVVCSTDAPVVGKSDEFEHEETTQDFRSFFFNDAFVEDVAVTLKVPTLELGIVCTHGDFEDAELDIVCIYDNFGEFIATVLKVTIQELGLVCIDDGFEDAESKPEFSII